MLNIKKIGCILFICVIAYVWNSFLCLCLSDRNAGAKGVSDCTAPQLKNDSQHMSEEASNSANPMSSMDFAASSNLKTCNLKEKMEKWMENFKSGLYILLIRKKQEYFYNYLKIIIFIYALWSKTGKIRKC